MSGGFIDPDKPLRDLQRAHRALEARVVALERLLAPAPTDPAQGEGQRPPLAGMAFADPDQPSKDQG